MVLIHLYMHIIHIYCESVRFKALRRVDSAVWVRRRSCNELGCQCCLGKSGKRLKLMDLLTFICPHRRACELLLAVYFNCRLKPFALTAQAELSGLSPGAQPLKQAYVRVRCNRAKPQQSHRAFLSLIKHQITIKYVTAHPKPRLSGANVRLFNSPLVHFLLQIGKSIFQSVACHTITVKVNKALANALIGGVIRTWAVCLG